MRVRNWSWCQPGFEKPFGDDTAGASELDLQAISLACHCHLQGFRCAMWPQELHPGDAGNHEAFLGELVGKPSKQHCARHDRVPRKVPVEECSLPRKPAWQRKDLYAQLAFA